MVREKTLASFLSFSDLQSLTSNSLKVVMATLLPPGLMFRWEFSVPELPQLPGAGKTLLNLPDQARLLIPSALESRPPFELRMGWNRRGLGISVRTTGKSTPLRCDPDRPLESDGLLVWIDTRNVQDVHRATRFCHLFSLMPSGEGAKGTEPAVRQLPVPRASADAPQIDTDDVLIGSKPGKAGYELSAWFPAEILNGFDPTSQPKLGFFCELRDAELGRIPISLDAEFPYDGDPSLWCTLSLAGAE